MKFDEMLRVHDPRTIRERAEASERQGYDCLCTVESAHNLFLPIALGAAATTRIEFGTDLAVAFARSPLSLMRWAGAATRGHGAMMRPLPMEVAWEYSGVVMLSFPSCCMDE